MTAVSIVPSNDTFQRLVRHWDDRGMHRVGLRAFVPFVLMASAIAQDHRTWKDYGGAADAAQYSALSQINRSNVSQLEIAWKYPTGDNNKYAFNPVVVDGMMYVLAKNNSSWRWMQPPAEMWAHPPTGHHQVITNRGINYWESKDRSERTAAVCEQSLPARHRRADGQDDSCPSATAAASI